MKPKYKTTGCARFFIFFLFFIPAVYFGATYFRGENGLQILKDFFHKITGKSASPSPSTDSVKETYTLDDCKAELKKIQDENDQLKREIREKENEIANLKAPKK
jgi:hypothetical protein